jgi:CBS domain-containing protein
MTVTAILKTKGSNEIATVRADATVREAVALLAEKRIGAAVVSPDGATIEGIISERDIVKSIARLGADALDAPVSTVMTRNVETCTGEERSQTLLQRMTAGRFRHMPVVEGARMTGVLSIGDVVKYRLDELEHEKTALEDMVKGF